jgi:predicted methyltransferase
MRPLFLIPLATTLALAAPAQAASPIADVICEPGARMTERMTRRQGATLSSTGLRSPEEVVELWTSPDGDWTMVIAYASGTSCIVAMGEHWSVLAPQDPA